MFLNELIVEDQGQSCPDETVAHPCEILVVVKRIDCAMLKSSLPGQFGYSVYRLPDDRWSRRDGIDVEALNELGLDGMDQL